MTFWKTPLDPKRERERLAADLDVVALFCCVCGHTIGRLLHAWDPLAEAEPLAVCMECDLADAKKIDWGDI